MEVNPDLDFAHLRPPESILTQKAYECFNWNYSEQMPISIDSIRNYFDVYLEGDFSYFVELVKSIERKIANYNYEVHKKEMESSKG